MDNNQSLKEEYYGMEKRELCNGDEMRRVKLEYYFLILLLVK
jgi:hypothetical protein